MSSNCIDIVCNFVEEPRRAARAVDEGRPLGLGILCFVIGGLSLFLAQSLLGRTFLPFGPFPAGAYCLWEILSGFALTGAVHLLVEFLGGRGSGASLFVLFGLSDLVSALLLPGVLLMNFFPFDSRLPIFSLFTLFSLFRLGLRARSIRDNYGVTMAKAWLALLLPYAGIGLIALGVVTLAIAGVASSLFHFIS